MIWRLMATILAMTDTGNISLVVSHTDWPDEVSCRQILASHYTPPPPTEINGRLITTKISASCVPVRYGEPQAVRPPVGYGDPQAGRPPPVRIPPPLAQMMPGFFGRPCVGALQPVCDEVR